MNLLGVLMETFASLSINAIKTALICLLRAAWIAGILPVLIASLPSPRLNSFHTLLLGFARRGKIMPSSSNRFTVPQSFFLHFYLLGVVWTTILLMGIWYFAYEVAPLGSESLSYVAAVNHLTGGSHVFSLHKSRFTSAEDRFNVWKSVFLLLLMEIHVLRRLYESSRVFNYSSSARMHIFGYLTGIYFYTAAPLSLCTFCALEAFNFAADQVAEFKAEGQEMLSVMDFDLWGYVKPITRLGWCQWAGAAIFAWGWFHQFYCHAILGSLRERGDQTAEYVIPHGDWFEIVSSPHYLAEMVIFFISLMDAVELTSYDHNFLASGQIIYAGLLVASGGTDFTICLLLGFVVANLSFAAAETHRWYLQKFEDYPYNRSLPTNGTAKSSVGVMRLELVMKSIVPVIMAGVLGIYVLTEGQFLLPFDGYAHFSSALAGLSASMAIGIVGDAGVRANAWNDSDPNFCRGFGSVWTLPVLVNPKKNRVQYSETWDDAGCFVLYPLLVTCMHHDFIF